MGSGHVWCRVTKGFNEPWLESAARRAQEQFEGAFAEQGGRLTVVPLKITNVNSVGEGIRLDLVPSDQRKWDWGGEFESELEVRRRRRWSGQWESLRSPEEVALWLQNEAEAYLRRVTDIESRRPI